ncbi:MAG: FAD-dependent oxidoreductase [Uliginosibacterium sp.]|nr:FAD-dependent oxidoreductase [Uliginosibacterium sp.]
MKTLILAGGGHAHLFVLEALRRAPRPDLAITLISPERWQYYSGMLPGWMAGHYQLDDCRLDLRTLADAAGINFIEDSLIGMNADKRCVCLSDGRPLVYDLLSLDTGSETDVAWLAELGERLLPVKPLGRFVAAWPAIRAAAGAQPGYRLVIAGGGAAGAELALAASRACAAHVTLLTGDSGLLPRHNRRTRHRIAAALLDAGIEALVQRGAGSPAGLVLKDGRQLDADCVIAATGARAPVWLSVARLALDVAGYVAVDATHRSLSHPEVFAAGDVCARSDTLLARSGVHAVRAGPVLAHNLFAALDGRPLKPYLPRRWSLYLLASGSREAVASWGPLSGAGRWVWRWKDWIDRRFMHRFTLGALPTQAKSKLPQCALKQQSNPPKESPP